MAAALALAKCGLSTSPAPISSVMIFGGGLMGSGIAQVAAQTGHRAVIVDQSKEILGGTESRIAASLSRVAKKKAVEKPKEFVDQIMANISTQVFTPGEDIAVPDHVDLIIEAIVENMAAKHSLFTSLDRTAPRHTLFASNTSSLSIDQIFSVTQRKERVGGLHFFNPVPMMKLVEVVKGAETSDETYSTLCHFGAALGKTVVKCGDTPGFLVNRLLIPYMSEAVKLVERGDATKEDVDTAMKLGAGYPMGPFELCDYVGLDTTLFIIKGWEERFPDEPMFKAPESLLKLVKEGKLGRKSGAGFYDYSSKL